MYLQLVIVLDQYYKEIYFYLYFSHGKALISLGEYYQAAKELHKAYELEPSNNSVFVAIQLVS